MPPPSFGCVAHRRGAGPSTQPLPGRPTSRTGVAAACACLLLAVALVVASPALAGAGTDPTTGARCGRDASGEPKRCVGPVTDESGGGGGTLTIAVSVVVGLAVAGAAFVLVRRQLSPPGPPEQSDR